MPHFSLLDTTPKCTQRHAQFCSCADLPVVRESSLLDMEDLPTIVPVTSINGRAAIDPMDSLELSNGEQRPCNSMHPDRYAMQLRHHRAHPAETEAVRSLLSVSVESSVTESSSSASFASRNFQAQGNANSSNHCCPEESAQETADARTNHSCTHTEEMKTATSLDAALSVAYTDVGSKTAEEVEALPGQQSATLFVKPQLIYFLGPLVRSDVES